MMAVASSAACIAVRAALPRLKSTAAPIPTINGTKLMPNIGTTLALRSRKKRVSDMIRLRKS